MGVTKVNKRLQRQREEQNLYFFSHVWQQSNVGILEQFLGTWFTSKPPFRCPTLHASLNYHVAQCNSYNLYLLPTIPAGC